MPLLLARRGRSRSALSRLVAVAAPLAFAVLMVRAQERPVEDAAHYPEMTADEARTAQLRLTGAAGSVFATAAPIDVVTAYYDDRRPRYDEPAAKRPECEVVWCRPRLEDRWHIEDRLPADVPDYLRSDPEPGRATLRVSGGVITTASKTTIVRLVSRGRGTLIALVERPVAERVPMVTDVREVGLPEIPGAMPDAALTAKLMEVRGPLWRAAGVFVTTRSIDAVQSSLSPLRPSRVRPPASAEETYFSPWARDGWLDNYFGDGPGILNDGRGSGGSDAEASGVHGYVASYAGDVHVLAYRRTTTAFGARVNGAAIVVVVKDPPNPFPPVPTASGPEVSFLRADVTGRIVVADRSGHVRVIDPRDGSSRPAGTLPPGARIGAPDTKGEIPFAVGNSIYILRPDGTTTSIGPPATRARRIGSFALSPSGRRLAVIVNPSREQEWVTTGAIELWDVASRTSSATGEQAVDFGISWFPDDRQIAYAEVLRTMELHLARVERFDIVTRRKVDVALGFNPLVSPDGSQILLQTDQAESSLCELEKADSCVYARVPPDWRASIALVARDRLIYFGWPTTGQAQYASGSRFPMPAIKVVDVRSGLFQTVLPAVSMTADVTAGSIPGPR